MMFSSIAGTAMDAAATIDQSTPDTGRRLIEGAVEEYTIDASILLTPTHCVWR